MKFSKIIGKIDSDEKKQLVDKCQSYLSEVFAELSTGWDINLFGSKIGGDPLLMQLVAPMPHYCDLSGFDYIPIKKACKKIEKKIELYLPLTKEDEENLVKKQEYNRQFPQIIETAATDGKVFYWAPQFVLARSKLGVRLLIGHEGMHAALLHPNRRGHRIPSLWNIAIDFKANFNVIDDLRARRFRYPEGLFRELADFISIDEYAAFIRDPYNPPAKMLPFSPRFIIERSLRSDYLESSYEEPTILFAEPNLKDELRQPEAIYDYLLKQVPKCEDCGNLFCYKVPEDVKEMKLKLKKIQEQNAKEYGTGKNLQM